MRVLNLKISAFGPYAGAVELNMKALGRQGIYLITGDTGAGKTTIFDAITYALYGEASGGSREPIMFRSKYADENTPTQVEMTFAYGEKVYQIRRNPEYERPAKRGDGMVSQKADAMLTYPDGRVVTKVKEVDRAVREIMGIDRNQFSQIAMIAQGDFLKLLLAETRDRQAIFRELFKTGYYQTLQERLKNESGSLGRQCEAARRSVDQYIGGLTCDEDHVMALDLARAKEGSLPVDKVTEIGRAILAEDEETDQKLTAALEQVEQELEQVSGRLGKAEEQLRAARNLQTAEASYSEQSKLHENLKAALDAETGKQAERDQLAQKIAQMEMVLPEYDVLDEVQGLLRSSLKAVKQNEAAYEQGMSQRKGLMEGLEELRREQEGLQDAELHQERLLRERELGQTRRDGLKGLEQALRQYERLCGDLKSAQEEYQRAFAEGERLHSVYSEKNRAFLDEQAGVLAAALQDGMACPVCGSLVHPHKAVKSETAPTEAELKKAKRAYEAAQQVTEKASSRAGEVRGAVSAKKAEIREKAGALFGGDGALPEEIKGQIAREIDEIDGKLAALSKEILQGERRITRRAELDRLVPQEEKRAAEMETALVDLKEKMAANKAKTENLKAQADSLHGKLQFESKAVAQAEKAALTEQKNAMARALEKAQQQFLACDKALDGLKGQIEQLKEMLANGELVDAEAETQRKATLLDDKKRITASRTAVHTRISTNRIALQHIEEGAAELAELEKRWAWVRTLSNTANGNLTGKEKIMLETYIQMTYFDRIIARANTRFMVMSGGQYELKRRQAAENNRSQSGLELNVIDHYNGTERSVKTLSGGESFKASLSLALGLSDEIQSSAGGIRLDTMFVDEGFGSLDEESLQQAIRALASLTEGNRLVGIISHVAELKEKIDKQIVVTKERTGGSHVKIVV